MSGVDIFEKENFNVRRSVLGVSSSSQSVRNSLECVFDSNSNDREATRLSESDIKTRSQKNKETWRYVLSVFDPIKGLPDRKPSRKHLGNSKPCSRRKLSKRSNYRKLESFFQSSNKYSGTPVPKKLEEFRSKSVQHKNSKTIDEKKTKNVWLSSKKVSKEEVKLGRDICSSISSSQVKAISVPTDMEVHSFESKVVNHNNYNSANQQESEIILNYEIKDFDDNVKSASKMQTSSSSGNLKLVANSSNLMKSGCGKQNDTPNFRLASKFDCYSGTSKGVLTRNNVGPKCLTLLTDRQRSHFNKNLANWCPSTLKLFANTNDNEDYNIVWSSSESEDGSKSSKVITNDNANEDYNIIWSSSDSEDGSKSSKVDRDICSSLSSSQVKAISVPTDMEVQSFESKVVNHNNHNSANQQESEIIFNYEIKDFDDNVKSTPRMQTSSSSGNVKLVAKSSNLMKSGCGKQNDTPNLRIASKLDCYSGTSKGVLTRNNVDPKCLTLLTDRQRSDFNKNLSNVCPSTLKLVANTNGNEDYNIVWSSSESEDGSKSSKVITNDNANEDYNIIWSSSDSEDGSKSSKVIRNDNANEDYNIIWSSSDSEDEARNNKSCHTKQKSKYAGSNTELDLLIQAIEKDRRRSNAIREKYATKRGGYSEKFKNLVRKAKMDFGFLSYEQSTGILRGIFAVVTKVEKSYGVCTAKVKLENDNSCCFFLERRVESVNDGDKLVSFVNSSRFYTVNDIIIFIQPNKIVSA